MLYRAMMIAAPIDEAEKRYKPPMIDCFIMFFIISFIVILIYEQGREFPTLPLTFFLSNFIVFRIS